jgi:hypothetical protein
MPEYSGKAPAPPKVLKLSIDKGFTAFSATCGSALETVLSHQTRVRIREALPTSKIGNPITAVENPLALVVLPS